MNKKFDPIGLFTNPASSGCYHDGTTLTVFKEGEIVTQSPIGRLDSTYTISPPTARYSRLLTANQLTEIMGQPDGVDDFMEISRIEFPKSGGT